MGTWEHIPFTNFHDKNLDWLLKLMKDLKDRVGALEAWRARHEQEYQELKDMVDSWEDRIAALEQWKADHEEAYNDLVETVNNIGGRVTIIENTVFGDPEHPSTPGISDQVDQNTSDIQDLIEKLAKEIADRIQGDIELWRYIQDLLSQIAGGDLYLQLENIIAYAESFYYVDQLSAMYGTYLSDDNNQWFWYKFEDPTAFDDTGFTTGTKCRIFVAHNTTYLRLPVTMSIRLSDNTRYIATISNLNTAVNFTTVDHQTTTNHTAELVTDDCGIWVELDTEAGAKIIGCKLENGAIATAFNNNIFTEYLRIFRSVINDQIAESIFNTELIRIPEPLDLRLFVYNRTTQTLESADTVGSAYMHFQIVNSCVMGELTFITPIDFSVDASDTNKIYYLEVEGQGLEDLPLSSIENTWSADPSAFNYQGPERLITGANTVRFPGSINNMYQILDSDETKVVRLRGAVTNILPPKVYDTIFANMGFSYSLPGNITSLDDINF